MVDIEKLREMITQKGFTIPQIAHNINIDKSTLYRRLGGGGEDFSIKEAEKISKLLNLNRDEVNQIFFNG